MNEKEPLRDVAALFFAEGASNIVYPYPLQSRGVF